MAAVRAGGAASAATRDTQTRDPSSRPARVARAPRSTGDQARASDKEPCFPDYERKRVPEKRCLEPDSVGLLMRVVSARGVEQHHSRVHDARC